MSSNPILKCQFFDKQIMAGHFHADFELFYVLQGNTVLTVSGSDYSLDPDDFFLINAGWSHSWSGEDNFLAGSILISLDELTDLFGNSPVFFNCYSKNLAPEDADPVRDLAYRLFTYSHAKEGKGRLVFGSLSYQFLSLMVDKFLSPDNDPQWAFQKEGPEKRVLDIMSYLNRNYAQSVSLGSLARHLNVTLPYLSKFFKDRFGVTFLSYLNAIRIRHAETDILRTEKSMTRIALDNGFPNSASFIRGFRKVNGITPSEYRKDRRSADTISANAVSAGGNSLLGPAVSDSLHGILENRSFRENITGVSNRENISVSADWKRRKEKSLVARPWSRLLHAGNAASLLRFDVREHIKLLHDTLHFEYLYIGNLLHPDMNIDPEDTGKPNFTELRKVLDFTVSLGMSPYIEIEFQEAKVPQSIGAGMVEATTRSRLASLGSNYMLFENFFSFLIRRYGPNEISKWKFSLERSTAIGNLVSENDYFKYFSSVRKMLKNRIPDACVGGPGFTIDFSEKRLQGFLERWLDACEAPDFINMYVFPYEMDFHSLKEGRNVTSADESFLENVLNRMNHVMQKLNLSDTELHVTFWNSTLSSRNVLNDSCFKSAYIMKSLLGSRNKCHLIGYWNVSDIPSSETGLQLPLFGGSGLVNQSGLKKPAYYAYAFLDKLYSHLLTETKHVIITADDHNRISVCCHNYKHFNYLYYHCPENRIKIEEQNLYFENQENLIIRFTISDLPEGSYLIRKRYVSESDGNIQNAWRRLSMLEDLTDYELDYLKAQSEPGLTYTRIESERGILSFEETLSPQEICLIRISWV